MRYALTVLLLMSSVATFDAGAKMSPNAPPRPAEWIEYERARDEWWHTLTGKLAADGDVDIAWAGVALGARDERLDDEDGGAPILPPTPSSGVARLLRAAYCEATDRCPEAFTEWAAAEPDNLAVLALAHHHHDERDAPIDFARAARYEDYSLALQELSGKIAARYDLTPPTKPQNYRPGGCVVIVDADRIEVRIAMMSIAVDESIEALAHDAALDPRLGLRLAELLIDAEGAPFAARHGANLGVAAADDPADRERYCRLAERADAIADLDEAVLTDIAYSHAFFDALRTRNGIEAFAAIAAQLPEDERVAPPDEAAIAACVARSDADE